MNKTFGAVLLALAAAFPAAAKDLRVAADGSGAYKTLLSALKAAVPGDVVVIQKPSGMVGIVLKKNGDDFVAQDLVPGSPAEAAGIKKGQKVVAVNGSNIAPLTIEQAVSLIRGPVGTTVTLKVAEADGGEPREVKIARGAVRWPVKTESDKYVIARNEKDDAAAFALARPLAKDGVEAAQAYLAFAYYYGRMTSKDLKEAAHWAQLAANAGDVAASRLLGVMYASGAGVPKDAAQSFTWSRAAAEKGDVFAMINLSWDYEHAYGTEKDLTAALEWARKAAAPSPWHTPESLAVAKAAAARLEGSGSASSSAEPAASAPTGAWWEPSAGDAPAASPAPAPAHDGAAPKWTEGK